MLLMEALLLYLKALNLTSLYKISMVDMPLFELTHIQMQLHILQ